MSEPTDPFELMRDLIPEATPNREQTERARNVLQAEIAAESQPTSRSQSRNRALARLAVAAVVFAIVAVSVTAFLSRGDTAVATLQEIAQAARAAEATDIPAGGFLFQQSTERSLRIVPGDEIGVDRDFAAYILTTDRSTWRSPPDGFVQATRLNRDPEFFSVDVERGYEDLGIADRDKLNRLVTEQFTGVADPILDRQWPSDADELLVEIIEVLDPSSRPQPRGHEVFGYAINMLAEPIDPALRAAVVEVIGLTEPTSIVPLADGSVRVLYDYPDATETRLTAVIQRDGSLRSRETTLLGSDAQLGIPAGTTVSSIVYSEWVPVRDLG